MLIRLATGLFAIVTFRRRAGPLTGPAKILDGDTIVVAGELVRLHGLDAPELDQTFWWRGERIACGMMAMAALEALTAGIQVRCQAVERDRHGRLVAKIFAPDGTDIRPQAGAGRMGARVPAILDGLCRRLGRGPQGQAGLVARDVRETLGMAVHRAAGTSFTVECGSNRVCARRAEMVIRLR